MTIIGEGLFKSRRVFNRRAETIAQIEAETFRALRAEARVADREPVRLFSEIFGPVAALLCIVVLPLVAGAALGW